LPVKLDRLQRHWDEFGRRDPYWAILTDPAKQGNKWDLDEFFETGEREVDDVLAWVASLGMTLRRGRALDFGCGAGRISQALARHFEHVIGVDIAPSMIALANTHNRQGERCRYVLNESADLRQFPDASVDFLYSRLVLQHLRPTVIKAYVAEFVRLLDAGGIAVFNVPASPLDAPVVGGTLKALAPMVVVRLYRRLRLTLDDRRRFPNMEVNGVPPAQLVPLLTRSGSAVVRVDPDQTHGDAGPGFLYCVTKGTFKTRDSAHGRV
jgi:SAM-dependent methyltransferase